MEEKKEAIDAGARLSYQYANIGKFSIGALTDISSTHKGYELSAEYSRGHFFENSMFAPFVNVKYQDKKLSNYYYGVKNSEAMTQRAAYAPSSALNYELGARYMYFINQKSSVIAMATYTILDDKINKSPIVDKNGIAKFALFYGYKF